MNVWVTVKPEWPEWLLFPLPCFFKAWIETFRQKSYLVMFSEAQPILQQAFDAGDLQNASARMPLRKDIWKWQLQFKSGDWLTSQKRGGGIGLHTTSWLFIQSKLFCQTFVLVLLHRVPQGDAALTFLFCLKKKEMLFLYFLFCSLTIMNLHCDIYHADLHLKTNMKWSGWIKYFSLHLRPVSNRTLSFTPRPLHRQHKEAPRSKAKK